MISETRNPMNEEVVTGYFSQHEDAQKAIDELMEEGFSAKQVGGAFHSRSFVSAAGLSAGNMSGSKTIRNAADSNTIGSGPASDTRAVTPAGLSTGSGSVISGAGKPGPIPGSEIRHRQRITEMPASSAINPIPATGGFHESHDESLWQRLKRLFSGDSEKKASNQNVVNSTSMNFGTGEGHLATNPEDNDYAYSGSAFESVFSGMGIPQEHAQMLARELRNGGAIVTVSATGRIADAERILNHNHGRIRYEAMRGVSTVEEMTPDGRVFVFGEVSRVYPRYLAPTDVSPARKAS